MNLDRNFTGHVREVKRVREKTFKEKAEDLIKKHEGLRLDPYRCTAGALTIGYGHNLDSNGITEEVAQILLEDDILNAIKDLTSVFGQTVFDKMHPDVKAVMVDMMFNLGKARFSKFANMIDAVKREDWPRVIREMRSSMWYVQVKNRAENLIKIVEEVNDKCQ